MIRLFLVDDHAAIREGVKTFLKSEPDMIVAGEVGDGREALRRIAAEPGIDLVVLDISLPGRDGLDVLQRLRRTQPRLPVLIFTMHDEEVLALRCMKLGAAGYLTKDSDPQELIQAIRTLVAGHKHVTPSLAERILQNWSQDPDLPPHENLSDREFSVLRLIAAGETVGHIAEKLGLNVRTVSTYRRRVLDKLEMETTAELIAYAIKHKLTD